MLKVEGNRRKEYRRRVLNLLRSPQSRKVWMRVIGKLLFIREAVGPTLRHLRALIWLANSKRGLIKAEGEAEEDLRWWKDQLSKPIAFKLRNDLASGAIVTDTSEEGIGAAVQL